MRRNYALWTSILFIGVFSLAWVVVPTAAQFDQGFTDSFDDPQLSGWEHSPEVIVSNGVLQVGPAQFAARLGAWQDFTLSIKLRYTGEGESNINYWATDQGSYLLMLGRGIVTLARATPQGALQELGRSETGTVNTSDWINLQVIVTGGAHTISVNGETIITAMDPDPLWPGGIVLLSLGQRTSEFDDMSLQTSPVAMEATPIEPAAIAAAQTATPTPQAGTWQDFLRSLSATQGSTFRADEFVINLLLAVLTSFILSRVYIYWGGSLSNRRKFAANFMLVTITTTFIILIVRSSVALSLGLVGALSIVRFRNAVKDPEELAYLFLAIGLGIGLGDNQRAVTLITLAVVIVVLGVAHLLRQTQADVNLHLTVSSHGSEKVSLQQVMDVVAQQAEKMRLLRYDETPEALEMSFVVEFRHISGLNRVREALKALSPSLQVSFLDNKGIW
jgi:uncharacterized membrane protein YhiD involved in acid resistance